MVNFMLCMFYHNNFLNFNISKNNILTYQYIVLVFHVIIGWRNERSKKKSKYTTFLIPTIEDQTSCETDFNPEASVTLEGNQHISPAV